MNPKNTVELDTGKARQALRLIELLEDLDDVQPVTTKVFLVGYSRGAVMAHRAAIAIMGGACGDGMGAKVTWLGLVDPVASGMTARKVRNPLRMTEKGELRANGDSIAAASG